MTIEEAIKIFEERLSFAEKKHSDLEKDYIDALYMAVEVLEKQIPMKPKGDYHSVPHYRCPSCNVSVKLFKNSIKLPVCHRCGQKLDWSDTERQEKKQ